MSGADVECQVRMKESGESSALISYMIDLSYNYVDAIVKLSLRLPKIALFNLPWSVNPDIFQLVLDFSYRSHKEKPE